MTRHSTKRPINSDLSYDSDNVPKMGFKIVSTAALFSLGFITYYPVNAIISQLPFYVHLYQESSRIAAYMMCCVYIGVLVSLLFLFMSSKSTSRFYHALYMIFYSIIALSPFILLIIGHDWLYLIRSLDRPVFLYAASLAAGFSMSGLSMISHPIVSLFTTETGYTWGAQFSFLLSGVLALVQYTDCDILQHESRITPYTFYIISLSCVGVAFILLLPLLYLIYKPQYHRSIDITQIITSVRSNKVVRDPITEILLALDLPLPTQQHDEASCEGIHTNNFDNISPIYDIQYNIRTLLHRNDTVDDKIAQWEHTHLNNIEGPVCPGGIYGDVSHGMDYTPTPLLYLAPTRPSWLRVRDYDPVPLTLTTCYNQPQYTNQWACPSVHQSPPCASQNSHIGQPTPPTPPPSPGPVMIALSPHDSHSDYLQPPLNSPTVAGQRSAPRSRAASFHSAHNRPSLGPAGSSRYTATTTSLVNQSNAIIGYSGGTTAATPHNTQYPTYHTQTHLLSFPLFAPHSGRLCRRYLSSFIFILISSMFYMSFFISILPFVILPYQHGIPLYLYANSALLLLHPITRCIISLLRVSFQTKTTVILFLCMLGIVSLTVVPSLVTLRGIYLPSASSWQWIGIIFVAVAGVLSILYRVSLSLLYNRFHLMLFSSSIEAALEEARQAELAAAAAEQEPKLGPTHDIEHITYDLARSGGSGGESVLGVGMVNHGFTPQIGPSTPRMNPSTPLHTPRQRKYSIETPSSRAPPTHRHNYPFGPQTPSQTPRNTHLNSNGHLPPPPPPLSLSAAPRPQSPTQGLNSPIFSASPFFTPFNHSNHPNSAVSGTPLYGSDQQSALDQLPPLVLSPPPPHHQLAPHDTSTTDTLPPVNIVSPVTGPSHPFSSLRESPQSSELFDDDDDSFVISKSPKHASQQRSPYRPSLPHASPGDASTESIPEYVSSTHHSQPAVRPPPPPTCPPPQPPSHQQQSNGISRHFTRFLPGSNHHHYSHRPYHAGVPQSSLSSLPLPSSSPDYHNGRSTHHDIDPALLSRIQPQLQERAEQMLSRKTRKIQRLRRKNSMMMDLHTSPQSSQQSPYQQQPHHHHNQNQPGSKGSVRSLIGRFFTGVKSRSNFSQSESSHSTTRHIDNFKASPPLNRRDISTDRYSQLQYDKSTTGQQHPGLFAPLTAKGMDREVRREQRRRERRAQRRKDRRVARQRQEKLDALSPPHITPLIEPILDTEHPSVPLHPLPPEPVAQAASPITLSDESTPSIPPATQSKPKPRLLAIDPELETPATESSGLLPPQPSPSPIRSIKFHRSVSPRNARGAPVVHMSSLASSTTTNDTALSPLEQILPLEPDTIAATHPPLPPPPLPSAPSSPPSADDLICLDDTLNSSAERRGLPVLLSFEVGRKPLREICEEGSDDDNTDSDEESNEEEEGQHDHLSPLQPLQSPVSRSTNRNPFTAPSDAHQHSHPPSSSSSAPQHYNSIAPSASLVSSPSMSRQRRFMERSPSGTDLPCALLPSSPSQTSIQTSILRRHPSDLNASKMSFMRYSMHRSLLSDPGHLPPSSSDDSTLSEHSSDLDLTGSDLDDTSSLDGDIATNNHHNISHIIVHDGTQHHHRPLQWPRSIIGSDYDDGYDNHIESDDDSDYLAENQSSLYKQQRFFRQQAMRRLTVSNTQSPSTTLGRDIIVPPPVPAHLLPRPPQTDVYSTPHGDEVAIEMADLVQYHPSDRIKEARRNSLYPAEGQTMSLEAALVGKIIHQQQQRSFAHSNNHDGQYHDNYNNNNPYHDDTQHHHDRRHHRTTHDDQPEMLLPIDIKVELADAALVEHKLLQLMSIFAYIGAILGAIAAFFIIIYCDILSDPLIVIPTPAPFIMPSTASSTVLSAASTLAPSSTPLVLSSALSSVSSYI